MSKEGCAYLVEKFTEAIDYARDEFEMSYPEAVGVCEVVKQYLISEALEEEEEDEHA